MNNPIALAVAPIKQLSIDSAVALAQRKVDAMLQKLRENDMDANKVAPYPNGNMSRTAYMIAKENYYFAREITHPTMLGRSPKDPDFRGESQDGIRRYLYCIAEQAGLDFDAYVNKLTLKVGKCDTAVLLDDQVWYDSMLIVTKGDVTEKWNTKVITNFSKFNKPFNQFPTRLKK